MEPSTALAPTGAPVVPAIFGGSEASNVFSTLSDPREALAAITSKSEPLADHLNKPFIVRELVAHMATVVAQDTGEVLHCPRILFVTDQGIYSTVAAGVVESLRTIIGLIGMPALRSLTVQAREQKTRRGFKTILLEVVAATGKSK